MLRTSIVLASVALALLLFIVFYERNTLSTTELEGRKGRVLDNFVKDKVTRIEVQRKGVTTVLVRVPPDPNDPLDVGGWRVEQPYKAKADREAVDNLIGALEWIDPKRTLGDASRDELQRFGLNAPRYRVKYDAGREQAGFSIGSPAADGGGVYLQLRGKASVFVVGNDVVESLDHDPADYHDKQLHEGVSIHTYEALSLRAADGGERKLSRRGGFDWLDAPYQSLASTPNLTTVIDAFDSLRATRFVTEAPQAGQGLEAPRFTFTLTSKIYDSKQKGKQVTEKLELKVGAACTGHAAESFIRVNQGAVFCAQDSELAKLDKPADALRETRLLPLDDSDIKAVRLRSGKRELQVEVGEKETRFKVLEQGKEQQSGVADAGSLGQWYSALRAVTIDSFSTLDAATRSRLEASGAVATFERGKNEQPYVVRVSSDGMTTLGSRLQEASLLHLPNDARELLSPEGSRFRKKRLLDEPELELSKITIARPDHSVEQVVRSKDGYELSEPWLGPADRGAVDELVRLLSKLEAVRFVADRALAAYGFAEPYRTVKFVYDGSGQRREHTLVIAALSGEQGRYARLDSDPAVFVVSNALLKKLEDPLVSRSAAALPRERLTSLELIAGAKRVRVEKDASGFTIAGAGDAGRARAEKLVQTMATLTATRALRYGEAKPDEGFEHPALKVIAKLADPSAEVTWSFVETPEAVRVRASNVPAELEVSRATLDTLLEH
jgi:hypothetical protein